MFIRFLGLSFAAPPETPSRPGSEPEMARMGTLDVAPFDSVCLLAHADFSALEFLVEPATLQAFGV